MSKIRTPSKIRTLVFHIFAPRICVPLVNPPLPWPGLLFFALALGTNRFTERNSPGPSFPRRPSASSWMNSPFSKVFLETFPPVNLRCPRSCKDDELNNLTLDKMKTIMDEIHIHHLSRGKVGSYFGVSMRVISRFE